MVGVLWLDCGNDEENLLGENRRLRAELSAKQMQLERRQNDEQTLQATTQALLIAEDSIKLALCQGGWG